MNSFEMSSAGTIYSFISILLSFPFEGEGEVKPKAIRTPRFLLDILKDEALREFRYFNLSLGFLNWKLEMTSFLIYLFNVYLSNLKFYRLSSSEHLSKSIFSSSVLKRFIKSLS